MRTNGGSFWSQRLLQPRCSQYSHPNPAVPLSFGARSITLSGHQKQPMRAHTSDSTMPLTKWSGILPSRFGNDARPIGELEHAPVSGELMRQPAEHAAAQILEIFHVGLAHLAKEEAFQARHALAV